LAIEGKAIRNRIGWKRIENGEKRKADPKLVSRLQKDVDQGIAIRPIQQPVRTRTSFSFCVSSTRSNLPGSAGLPPATPVVKRSLHGQRTKPSAMVAGLVRFGKPCPVTMGTGSRALRDKSKSSAGSADAVVPCETCPIAFWTGFAFYTLSGDFLFGNLCDHRLLLLLCESPLMKFWLDDPDNTPGLTHLHSNFPELSKGLFTTSSPHCCGAPTSCSYGKERADECQHPGISVS